MVEILDARNEMVTEKFYKEGTTIELRCSISQMPQSQTIILWQHGEKMLNYDTTRGGIRFAGSAFLFLFLISYEDRKIKQLGGFSKNFTQK